jgi:hypothetical protein
MLLIFCSLTVYNQKYQKHFAAIIVFVPTCKSIPLAPHGFDNIFILKGTTIKPPTVVGYHHLFF